LIKDEIISLTGEHPLWVQGKGWVQAKNIQRGDILATIDGDTIVLGNRHMEYSTKVFNFAVKNTHNYFVGLAGLWAHNIVCRPNRTQPLLSFPGVVLRPIKASELFNGHGSNTGIQLSRNLRGTKDENGVYQGGAYPALNNPGTPAFQSHHIIPFSLRDHDLLEASNFNINSIHNGIPLPCDLDDCSGSTIHFLDHPNYTEVLEDFLDEIQKMRTRDKDPISDPAAADAIIDGIEDLREALANGTIPLTGNPPREVYENILMTALQHAELRQ